MIFKRNKVVNVSELSCGFLRATMNRVIRCTALFTLIAGIFVVPFLCAAFPTTWSTEAISLFPESKGERKFHIMSRDKKYVVMIDDTSLVVLKDGKRLSGSSDNGVALLSELGWAPDSKAFFINSSDGGSLGTWQTKIYLLENDKIRIVQVTNEVANTFKQQYTCTETEEPNLAAIKWLNGSRNLIVVAEVPPHSTCPKMGKILGYVIAVPSGKIVEQFDQKQLIDRWNKSLSIRIRSANS